MSHDYAKRAAQHKQKIGKNDTPRVSKTFMAITFISIACFAAFLYYLTQLQPEVQPTLQKSTSTPVKPEKTEPKVKTTRTPVVETSKADDEYDFYKLLPQTEVIPPRVEEYQSKPIQQAGAKTYLLQAGSFRHHEDADRLRAKLILQGLEVTVKLAKGRTGTNWYRVLVGPFTSRSKLNHAQDILARANTESMLIEIKQ